MKVRVVQAKTELEQAEDDLRAARAVIQDKRQRYRQTLVEAYDAGITNPELADCTGSSASNIRAIIRWTINKGDTRDW